MMPARDQPPLQLCHRHVQKHGQVPQLVQPVPGGLAQQQIVAFRHDDPCFGRHHTGRPARNVDIAVKDRHNHLAPCPQPLQHRLETGHIKSVGRPLGKAPPPRIQDGVVQMKAVHRHQRRLWPQTVHQRFRYGGFTRPRCPGNGNQHPPRPRRRQRGDARCQRFHQAATASTGGSFAPVMKATASDIV